MRLVLLIALISVMCLPGWAESPALSGGIQWQDWSDAAFQQAKKQNRLVILDLEAVWCHWCHVMDKETYKNPAVIKLIQSKYIAMKVDQDSRPDLSSRYEDYGWPATIIFDGSGNELAKRSGYVSSKEMTELLAKLSKNPKPEPEAKEKSSVKYGKDAFLTPALKKELQSRIVTGYDNKLGGWNTDNKFLDWDTTEYCMARAKSADVQYQKMAKGVLAGQLKLIDPVWGGVYQYSTDNDWAHPHFEKIMSIQAEDMRIYSLAYMQWRDSQYLKAAGDIHRYLKDFLLSPQGAFYTSQDADLIQGQHSAGYFKLADAQRRKLGIPRIDKHMYARENGWAINALAFLYAATGDAQYLQEAVRAAQWVIANRSIPGGGFRHDDKDAAGPYLSDTLAMGRAFLSLYGVTGDRQWLARAQQSGDFIAQHFAGDKTLAAGLATADLNHYAVKRPQPLLDENVMAARFANLLYQYDGKPLYKQIAQQAMRYIATPEIAKSFPVLVGGPLLADMELSTEPTHITIVGSKQDQQAKVLFAGAVRYPGGYKRIDWLDVREGPLPNNDVEYPQLKQAAAFACSNKRCSRPVFKPDGIAIMVDRLSQ